MTRAAFYLASAALLHALLTLLAGGPRSPRVLAPTEGAKSELGIVPVLVEPARAPASAPPGGGAPTPAPTSREAAAPRATTAQAAKAPSVPPAPTMNPQVVASPPEAPTAAADLVSQASNHVGVANVTATPARVAPDQSALGPYPGTGPGSRDGPGGRGAGFGRGGGRLTTSFAFGGPSGAFRADVCFIPDTTESLRQLRGCKTEVTFFTDHLDIPPRSFTDGFPGITSRTEWFAIYYRGKFRVQTADYYTFRLISDDGSLLYVDGHLIIDNDRQHPPAAKRATVPLAAGEHLLNVEYYQGPRDRIALQLFIAGSDGNEKLFGPVI